MNRSFIAAVEPPHGLPANGPAWWFAVRDGDVLTIDDPHVLPVLPDPAELGVTATTRHFLGMLDGRPCYAIGLEEDYAPPSGEELAGLRSLYGRVDDTLFALAGRAVQIVAWDRTHRFCGRCGTPTELAPGERAKRCPACGLLNFPRLSPAVITLVERDDHVLLARNHRFTGGMYSVLAGFVEPGESLEEAVQREIAEEVSIGVTNLRYFGSQPWPFPNSLMIGFTADYAAGEIAIDNHEIADAAWFAPDNLPLIPQKLSIARRLIDAYLTKHGVSDER
ncbi:MAG TPA: NAD(+) diphosphatase [Thermomicrobiales bacterium]|nr:NAD(+) diphosphatase [Thermomicrobiales bacterium]